jgi:hypothetical protein
MPACSACPAIDLLPVHVPPTPCSQPAVSYKTNAVKTTARGYRVVDFADGGRVEIHYPAYYLKGEPRQAAVAK